MGSFSTYSSTVLMIKYFPLLFNDQDRQEFLEHFGASRIRCVTRFKKLTNLIVADFGTRSQAAQALARLHQLEILARRLVAEYCPLELAQIAFSTQHPSFSDDDITEEHTQLNGISPGVNQIRYSLPSERLSYAYPPIDAAILSNITDALRSVPAFYTQVLHLMNKMSLPCPMVTDMKRMQRRASTSSVPCQTDESAFVHTINMDTDDDESEIDDGEEEERVKRRCRLTIRTPIGDETLPTTHIDVTIGTEPKRRPAIELKMPQTLESSRMDANELMSPDRFIHGFGRLDPMQPRTSTPPVANHETETLPPLPLVPFGDLAKHRLNEEQLQMIDNGRLYQNYTRGEPSQRLYIKNINTKHVDERVLHSIYDRYREEGSTIDIRLMREGKMKGQAFVTLPSEDAALHALNDTNGYVLHEKPLIVQFARTAKAPLVI